MDRRCENSREMNPLVWHLRELICRNGSLLRVRLLTLHTTRHIKIGAEALALLYADQPKCTTQPSIAYADCVRREKLLRPTSLPTLV